MRLTPLLVATALTLFATALAPGIFAAETNKPPGPNIPVGAPSKSPALINPGETWPDNRGKHFQAHGGGVIQVGDTWYWFGEDRGNETTETKPPERYVSCYASRDLIHSEFRNKVAGGPPPVPELKPPCVLERPKVPSEKGYAIRGHAITETHPLPQK